MSVKNIYVLISVMDPYPKKFEEQASGSTVELALKRAIQQFRKKHWSRRPLKSFNASVRVL